MNVAQYRHVLALPRMRALMITGSLARIPATASGFAITLHVVTSLGLDFTRAGVAGAVTMIGIGLGGPVFGWMLDKFGLRATYAVTMPVQALYWFTAPSLSYPVLVIFGGLAGFAAIPIFSVLRQFIAATVPEGQRRPAFAMDSMAVDLAYMIGPAVAVGSVTLFGSPATLYGVGAALIASGLALYVMNPPIRSAGGEQDESADGATIPRRQWLRPGVIGVLLLTAATMLTISATELSIVAALKDAGSTQWTGLVIALWCAYSIVGGFIYGALPRGLSPLLLTFGLGVLTLPVALFSGPWWWLIITLIPCGMLVAPTLTSTVDTLSRWVPSGARGEAMGLHGTAMTAGLALGPPLAGAIMDNVGPHWGFAAAGLAGAVLVAITIPLWQRAPRTVAEHALAES